LSTFTPTSIRFDPPDAPDDLGGAVLRSLARSLPEKASWGPVKTLFLGAISFGLLPLLILPRRLRWFETGQRGLLRYAQSWLSTKHGIPDDAGRNPGNVSSVEALAELAGVVGLALGLIAYFSHPAFSHLKIWSVTWGFHSFARAHPGQAEAARLHFAWLAFLSVAYMIHFLAVNYELGELRRTVRDINALVSRGGLNPISRPQLLGGAWPLWIFGGLILSTTGALWGIPMMLAAAAQRRYINHTSRDARQGVARVVRDAMCRDRLESRVFVPRSLRPQCPNEKCAARIPPGARFCPSCGRSVRAVA
jgi:hypothetical protein